MRKSLLLLAVLLIVFGFVSFAHATEADSLAEIEDSQEDAQLVFTQVEGESTAQGPNVVKTALKLGKTLNKLLKGSGGQEEDPTKNCICGKVGHSPDNKKSKTPAKPAYNPNRGSAKAYDPSKKKFLEAESKFVSEAKFIGKVLSVAKKLGKAANGGANGGHDDDKKKHGDNWGCDCSGDRVIGEKSGKTKKTLHKSLGESFEK